MISGFTALHSIVICVFSGLNDEHIDCERGQFTANIFIDLKNALILLIMSYRLKIDPEKIV